MTATTKHPEKQPVVSIMPISVQNGHDPRALTIEEMSPAQRKDLAELVASHLTPDECLEVFKHEAGHMTVKHKQDVAKAAMTSLQPEDQKDVLQHFAGMGEPSTSTRDRLWTIVVGAFALVLIGSFMVLAASVFYTSAVNTSVQIILTVFTSVAGFLVGLFVPSPLKS
jgi:hypothetical protein